MMSHLDQSSAAQHADLVRGAATSSAPGRMALAASWRRSLLHHHLDPQSLERRPLLEARSLHIARQRAEDMLRLGTPLLDRLAAVSLGAGGAVFLADRDGQILDGRMHDSDGSYFSMAGLRIGSDWSESSEGTNAIGTCLADGRPALISRDQHFFARNVPLTCIGAPIEAADGSLAGVINVSSCQQEMSLVQMRLTAIAVQEAARQIAMALFQASFPKARLIILPGDPALGPSLVAVDRDDLVLGANRLARRQLHVSAEDIARHIPLDDLLAEDETGPRPDLARALRSEVTRALQRTGGNVARAARDLGIGRATLYRKMKVLGLDHRPDEAQ